MDDTRSWLALLHAPQLNPTKTVELLSACGGAADVLAAGRTELGRLGVAEPALGALLRPDEDRIAADLDWLGGAGRHLVTRGDARYPPLLAATPGAPVALFVAGDPDFLAQPQLAVVGSRTPTRTGGETAYAFAAHLAARGLTVTSGLATGIDAAAHEGALTGIGSTVAVCGTGLDQVYPAGNDRLAARIRASGALVSEFPTGTPPRRAHFPQRNRIIAGLSLGTLVVEAAHRSGSLITAHRAIEYGREVFAIPGSIHNPVARGCHRLIREGARLVESADDILAELAPLFRAAPPPDRPAGPAPAPAETLDDDYLELLENVGFEATSVDTIVARSGLTAESVSSMLLILELRGYVSPAAGGGFSRTSKRPAR